MAPSRLQILFQRLVLSMVIVELCITNSRLLHVEASFLSEAGPVANLMQYKSKHKQLDFDKREQKRDLLDYLRPKKEDASVEQVGNNCPENEPWPCKTPNNCLSFDFICDGMADCPDSYDEDPNLCTAKDRPAFEILQEFIKRYENWLVPNILGPGKPSQLALRLIESKTLTDYARSVNMSEQQRTRLRALIDAVENGRQMGLLLMGMPPEAWDELVSLFGRIASSGFLKE